MFMLCHLDKLQLKLVAAEISEQELY